MSRLLKNSGTIARIVKYMSSFRLHFSRENLLPLRNVISLRSSEINKTALLPLRHSNRFEVKFFIVRSRTVHDYVCLTFVYFVLMLFFWYFLIHYIIIIILLKDLPEDFVLLNVTSGVDCSDVFACNIS